MSAAEMSALALQGQPRQWSAADGWQYGRIKRRVVRAARRGHNSTRVGSVALRRAVHQRLVQEGYTLVYAVFLFGPFIVMW